MEFTVKGNFGVSSKLLKNFNRQRRFYARLFFMLGIRSSNVNIKSDFRIPKLRLGKVSAYEITYRSPLENISDLNTTTEYVATNCSSRVLMPPESSQRDLKFKMQEMEQLSIKTTISESTEEGYGSGDSNEISIKSENVSPADSWENESSVSTVLIYGQTKTFKGDVSVCAANKDKKVTGEQVEDWDDLDILVLGIDLDDVLRMPPDEDLPPPLPPPWIRFRRPPPSVIRYPI